MNWYLFVLMLGLAVAGVFFIRSATNQSDAAEMQVAAGQQRMWLIVGLVLFFVVSLTNYEFILRIGPLIYAASLLLLVAVLFIGHEVNGAKSWIRFAGVGIQPIEFSKVAYVIGLSWLLLSMSEHVKKLWFLIGAVGVTACLPILLIMRQPDLGGAAVFMPITFCLLWVGGASKRYLMIPVLAAVFGGLFGYLVIYKAQWDGTLQGLPKATVDAVFLPFHKKDKPDDAVPKAPFVPLSTKKPEKGEPEPTESKEKVLLKSYQLNRIKTFFNPDLDPLGAAWTIRQSLIAIGSGGLKGKGYLKGDQNIYGFLPKNIAYNDFIFSVIGEECGFVGSSIFVICEGLLIMGMLSVASRSKDMGGALLAAGMAGMFFAHYFENVGMTIKVLPITGIPLPFTSYGGSFLVACMIGMGLVQSVWIHRRDYYEKQF
ncbi:MAG: FtsW/RodA/SpoVE family cell cycle protein [Methylacidiphilales bacterium]|nr:FtsW/RodA/SpoVE family cell cycle protein [Candidatus Methylacidiphilales bacterium]